MWDKRPKSDGSDRTQGAMTAVLAEDPAKIKGQAHRARANARSREMSQGAREIGEIPPVMDQARRDKCKYDLKLFCEEYLPGLFPDPWAEFHLTAIEILQEIILTGGMFVNAIPRGSGKSALCAGAAIWCGVYGHRPYAVIVCATDTKAGQFLKNIKRTMETSHLLAEDFPEVCTPINALEHLAQRANGQTYNGQPTFIEWSADALVFPSIPGSAASGFRIATAGITGDIRGLVFCNSDGEWIRPSFVICDDCQTDESAKSVTQTQDRIDITNGAVLGLAGKEAMAVAMCVTVIRTGDYADHFLNSDDWNGQRAGILDKLPSGDCMAKWMEYRDIQRRKIRPKEKAKQLADFYLENQKTLDGDIKPTWASRFDPKVEKSAIQAAMNKYFLGGAKKFHAEYQNCPEDQHDIDIPKVVADDIVKRLKGTDYQVVPQGFDLVTTFIDIQKRCLFYIVMALKKDGFDSAVIDGGIFPKQGRTYVDDLANLSPSLQSESGASDAEMHAAILWGLNKLGEQILDKEWIRQDGTPLKIKRGLIDINYPDSQTAVAEFCRNSKWKDILYPSRGVGSQSGRRFIADWPEREGEDYAPKGKRHENQWMIGAKGNHLVREVQFQTDFWKGRVHKALSVPQYASGSMMLWGKNSEVHEMVADHVALELSKPEKKQMHGQTITVYHKIGERRDLGDCVVGSLVAGAIEGCELRQEEFTLAPKPNYSTVIEAEYL